VYVGDDPVDWSDPSGLAAKAIPAPAPTPTPPSRAQVTPISTPTPPSSAARKAHAGTAGIAAVGALQYVYRAGPADSIGMSEFDTEVFIKGTQSWGISLSDLPERP
jgi:hypothetical protein